MMRALRELTLALPGEPLAAALLPAGAFAVACARAGDLLLGVFNVGDASNGLRRSERLLRLGPAPSEPSRVSMLPSGDGSDEVLVVAGSDVFRVDLDAMAPVWRFCLDADGAGVCAPCVGGLLIADPPCRATLLDWEGEERASVSFAADVVAVQAAGQSALIALSTGAIHSWDPVLGTSAALGQAPGHVLIAGRCGLGGDYLWWGGEERAIVMKWPDGSITEIASPCQSMAIAPGGDAVLASLQGAQWVGEEEVRAVGDFAVRACTASPSGHVLGCTDHGVLVIPVRGAADLLAFPSPVIIVPEAPGVWILGASGELAWWM